MLEIRTSGSVAMPSFATRGGVSAAQITDIRQRLQYLLASTITPDTSTVYFRQALPDDATLSSGTPYTFVPTVTSGDNPTLTVGAEGPYSLRRPNGDFILTGDLLASNRYEFEYNETPSRFLLVSGVLGTLETKVAGIETGADVTDALNIRAAIDGQSLKTTPVDDDAFAILDSESFAVLKRLAWSNVKAGMFSAWGVLVAAGTGKTTPVDADTLAISDSAASGATKKLSWANLKAGVFSAWGALAAAATGKTTPVDADVLVLSDSAASNATKKLTWANLKATLKAYLDTLYQPVAAVLTATTASFTTTKDTKLTGIEALADVTDAGNVGSSIHGAAAKTTLVDADEVSLIDSAASNVLKRITWANVKAVLKAYLDTLYPPLARTISAAGLATGGGDLSANRTLTVPAASRSETAARTISDKAVTPDGLDAALDPINQVRAEQRPGVRPDLFTGSIDDDPPGDLPALDTGLIVATAEGPAVRITGAGIVAMRARVPIELGRLYASRGQLRRHLNPTDPVGDAVDGVIAWYDSAGNALAGSLAETAITPTEFRPLTSADGVVSFSVSISRDLAADIVPPAAARQAVAFIRCYGSDGQTDIYAIDLVDVTAQAATIVDTSGLVVLTQNGPAQSVDKILSFSVSPTVPTALNSNEAVSKGQMDAAVASGANAAPHTAVRLATTANITLSGEQTIDGVLTSASDVLVKDQSTATQNGAYTSAAGAWSRRATEDAGAELVHASFLINEGSQAGQTWVVDPSLTSITLGVTNITFNKLSDLSRVVNLNNALTSVALVGSALTATAAGLSGAAPAVGQVLRFAMPSDSPAGPLTLRVNGEGAAGINLCFGSLTRLPYHMLRRNHVYEVVRKSATRYQIAGGLPASASTVYRGTASERPIVMEAWSRPLISVDQASGAVHIPDLQISEPVVLAAMRANLRGPVEYFYQGDGPIWPLFIDRWFRPVLSFDEAGSQLSSDLLASASVGTIAETALDPSLVIPRAANRVYGVVSYLQSLSQGGKAQPAVSTTQPYDNLTFATVASAGGVKTSLTGSGLGNESAMTASVPLVEDDLPTSGVQGETVLSGACNGATELAIVENGLAETDAQFFGSAAGRAGALIAGLRRGSTNYTNLMNHLKHQKSIVVGAGKTYRLAFLLMVQGAGDPSLTDSDARTNYEALMDEIDFDVTDTTGLAAAAGVALQAEIPHHLWSGSFYLPAYSAGGHPNAIRDMCNARANAWFIGSLYKYQQLGIDPPHFSNTEAMQAGRMHAWAMKKILFDQVEPTAMQPISATVQGTTVRIRFEGHVPPLRFDAATMGAAITNEGFVITSDSGDATIASRRADSDGKTAVFEIAAPLGANPRVRGAEDFAASHPDTYASTLRGSRRHEYEFDGTTYQDYDWVLPFDVPITELGS